MKHNDIIEKLSILKLEEVFLKRSLDTYYNNEKARTMAFNRLKKVKKEIDKLNFKLRIEKEINNENNNTK
jgi:hypothetical protein